MERTKRAIDVLNRAKARYGNLTRGYGVWG